MTVLLTGAHGTVGTAVTAATSAYDHVLLDREPAPDELGDGSPHPHRDRETVVVGWAQTAQSRPSRTP